MRLPVPWANSDCEFTECTVLTPPYMSGCMCGTKYIGNILICQVQHLNGEKISEYGGPLVWPAAYLLPLWDSDEDQTVEHEKEVMT